MSYSSRVYRQRNAHTHDEKSNDAFFSKQHDLNKNKSSKSFFQSKLNVNKPGDKFEKEADSVANSVVNKTGSTGIQKKKISGIQRLATPAEEEKLGTNESRMEKDKEVQKMPIQRAGTEPEKEKLEGNQKGMKADTEKEKLEGDMKKQATEKEEEEKKGSVQTKHEASANAASPTLSSKIKSNAGKGNTLPKKTLKEMNSAFGRNFNDVRIHKDADAAAMNKEIQAQAFTHGKDIYFNQGKFNPEESQGKNLLAHELTHVVQQNKK